jgi:protein associated with RNAse G/E
MQPENPATITLQFARMGKPLRVFHAEFLEDNGICLKTWTKLLPEHRKSLSLGFQADKWLESGQWIASIAKYLYDNEHFAIMKILDDAGQVLGFYVDIATPMQRTGEIYPLTDLCLELWLTPQGKASILDEDEFEQACSAGLIDPPLAQTAQATVERLLAEIQAGLFPRKYIDCRKRTHQRGKYRVMPTIEGAR